jgi:hypothetical protein
MKCDLRYTTKGFSCDDGDMRHTCSRIDVDERRYIALQIIRQLLLYDRQNSFA